MLLELVGYKNLSRLLFSLLFTMSTYVCKESHEIVLIALYSGKIYLWNNRRNLADGYNLSRLHYSMVTFITLLCHSQIDKIELN